MDLNTCHIVPIGEKRALCGLSESRFKGWIHARAEQYKCRECVEHLINAEDGLKIAVPRRPKQFDRALPQVLILTMSDVIRVLGSQITKDCLAGGWLKPCCVKDTGSRGPGKKFYSATEVDHIQHRILNGEYPGQRRH